MKSLFLNTDKWDKKIFPMLLITGVYPGSGKSKLAAELVSEVNESKLIQLDELYVFLRLDKWHPEIFNGMNVEELEKYLEGNKYMDEIVLEREGNIVGLLDKYRIDALLLCIKFIKEKKPTLYFNLLSHKFGEEYYLVGKNYHSDPIWQDWTQFVLDECKKSEELVIVEGGQLLESLAKKNNEDLLKNNPLIVLVTPRLIATYRMVIRKMLEEKIELKCLRRYFFILFQILKRYFSQHTQRLIEENERNFGIIEKKLIL